MKKVQSLTRMLFLAVFVFGTFFAYSNVEARVGGNTTKAVPTLISAQSNYPAGTLLKIKNRAGAAVYQIGSNGKKHVFPDQKTFMTWHDNFNDVIEVDQATLDNYEDGGPVTFQPDVSLATSPCTAKVYAVGDDGEIVHIPDEATAKKYYGQGWQSLVKDVDCGMFSVSYKVKSGFLGEVFPNGTYMQDEDSNELYLIKDGLKRKVARQVMKKLTKRLILRVKNMHQRYNDGEDLDVEEEDLSIFDPEATKHTKVLICHKGKRTLRIPSIALQAHLAHGSTEGPCDTEEPATTLPVCDHNGDGARNLSDVALFAQCQSTFDVNGDGMHSLADISLYAANNQNNAWCATNFVCNPTEDELAEPEVEPQNELAEPEEVTVLNVCDHNYDGERDLSDIGMFTSCKNTFDVNGDGLHNLVDVGLYAQNNQDNAWCYSHFICEPVYCENTYTVILNPGATNFEGYGLEVPEYNDIYKYQVKLDNGEWSQWYTPGYQDIDPSDDSRRMWAHFPTNGGKWMHCGDDSDPSSSTDLTVNDISVSPANPVIDEEATITVEFLNSGDTEITRSNPLSSILLDFEDFDMYDFASEVPIRPTQSNPFSPGDTTYYVWSGKFTSDGTKELEATIDFMHHLQESDETNNSLTFYVDVMEEEEEATLDICDHNGDGVRDLEDVGYFAGCNETFDVNNDGIHDLVDVSAYAQNNQDDAWCVANFVCDPNATSTQQ